MEAWGENSSVGSVRAYKPSHNQRHGYDELEDKYLRLKDAHHALKKVAHDQETKIKQMATKLVRLTSDLKKYRAKTGTAAGAEPGSVAFSRGDGGSRDVDTELLIESKNDTIRELRKKNESLAKKLIYFRNLAGSGEPSRRASQYDGVAARTDSGLVHAARKAGLVPGMRSKTTSRRRRQAGPPRPASAAGRFESLDHPDNAVSDTRPPIPRNAESENLAPPADKMQSVIAFLRSKLLEAEQSLSSLESRNSQLEDEVVSLRDTLKASTNPVHTAALLRREQADEMQVLKLEAVIASLKDQLARAQSQSATSTALLDPIKSNQNALIEENKSLRDQLRAERLRSGSVDALNQRISVLESALAEAEVMLNDERAAKASYAEENARLRSSSVFSSLQSASESSRLKATSELAAAKESLAQMSGEAASLRGQIQELAAANAELSSQLRKANLDNMKADAEAKTLREQVASLASSGVDMVDLQRALALVKAKKAGAKDIDGAGAKVLEFLVPTAPLEDQEEANAGLIRDLAKAHEMLELQMELNNELKATNAELLNDISLVRADYEDQLAVYATQLDAKSDTIARLEEQLTSFLYSAPGKRLQRQPDSSATTSAHGPPLSLRDDENLLELVVGKIVPAPGSALARSAASSTSRVFVAFDVYDFETMVTPLVPSSSPVFDYTAQYVVRVTPALFEYLTTAQVVMDVYLAAGLDYERVGTTVLPLADLVSDVSGRNLARSLSILPVDGSDAPLGTLRMALRMLRPMEEALALHAKRRELMGVLDPEKVVMSAAARATAATAAVASTNDLSVHIMSLTLAEPLAPSATPVLYYQLYNQDRTALSLKDDRDPDEPTVFRVGSTSSFPLRSTPELHAYLTSRELELVLVNTRDPKMSSYLGVASVPLASLTTGAQSILGSFAVYDQAGLRIGDVSVELQWTAPYTEPMPGSPAASVPRVTATQRAQLEDRASARAHAPSAHPNTTDASTAASRTLSAEDADLLAAPHFDANDRYSLDADTQLAAPDHVLTVSVDGVQFNQDPASLGLAGELVLMYAFLDNWVEALPVDRQGSSFALGHRRSFAVVPGSSAEALLDQECAPEILQDHASEFGVFEFTLLSVVSPTVQNEIGLAVLPFRTLIASATNLTDASLEIVSTTTDAVIGTMSLSITGVDVLVASANRTSAS